MQKFAEFYVFRIIDHKTTYSQVPAALKPLVAKILTEMEMKELIKE